MKIDVKFEKAINHQQEVADMIEKGYRQKMKPIEMLHRFVLYDMIAFSNFTSIFIIFDLIFYQFQSNYHDKLNIPHIVLHLLGLLIFPILLFRIDHNNNDQLL